MNYGRETVSNLLRKAGQGIIDFDRRYAERVERDMGGVNKSPIRVMLGGTPLSAESEFTGDTRLERIIAGGALAGAYATNAAYRYGLPAAGVTLAGKGLYDLTQGMNQQTEGTLNPN